MLTSRFQATRGLFWNGPRNFEPRSHDEYDPDLAPALQASSPHRQKDVWLPTYDLGPYARRIISRTRFRTWNPPARDLTTRLPRPLQKSESVKESINANLAHVKCNFLNVESNPHILFMACNNASRHKLRQLSVKQQETRRFYMTVKSSELTPLPPAYYRFIKKSLHERHRL
ncbi:hypothetical protein AVEN_185662-1 [Araneus ventricosus]|uniref:Uncharacterized protein n=1 Tax=Araneus ventricosus TaxID=182803 RepID=A0A4Y2FVG2_ARAVE|nr:hypothetical protein AVEN_185662-1 [Araneus ventricosus]